MLIGSKSWNSYETDITGATEPYTICSCSTDSRCQVRSDVRRIATLVSGRWAASGFLSPEEQTKDGRVTFYKSKQAKQRSCAASWTAVNLSKPWCSGRTIFDEFRGCCCKWLGTSSERRGWLLQNSLGLQCSRVFSLSTANQVTSFTCLNNE